MSRGKIRLLKTNKRRITTIEYEQNEKKEEQQLLVILTKWKKKGVATIIGENEQRIDKRSSNCYSSSLLLQMNKW